MSLIGHTGTNFIDIWNKNDVFEMSSAIWRPFWLGIRWNLVTLRNDSRLFQGVFFNDRLYKRCGWSFRSTRKSDLWWFTTLKRKCHFNEIFITMSCQNDNVRCNQWWQFRQNENISVLVYVTIPIYQPHLFTRHYVWRVRYAAEIIMGISCRFNQYNHINLSDGIYEKLPGKIRIFILIVSYVVYLS